MSNFNERHEGIWQHNDLACVAFPRKPPEWIAPYLVKPYDAAYAHGERSVLVPAP